MEKIISDVETAVVEKKQRKPYTFINRKPKKEKVLDPNRKPVGRPRKHPKPDNTVKRPVGRPRKPDELKKKYIKKHPGRYLRLPKKEKQIVEKLSPEEKRKQTIEFLMQKEDCECGMQYTLGHKKRHLKTNLHTKRLNKCKDENNKFMELAKENKLDGVVGQDNSYLSDEDDVEDIKEEELDKYLNPDMTETESINTEKTHN